MTKHTPGPWVIAERVRTARIDNARMVRPADHCNYEHGATAIIGTSEADANLIAAAPELLQVLQEIVRKDLLVGAIKHDARAAIAKATGGSV